MTLASVFDTLRSCLERDLFFGAIYRTVSVSLNHLHILVSPPALPLSPKRENDTYSILSVEVYLKGIEFLPNVFAFFLDLCPVQVVSSFYNTSCA